MKLPLQGVIDCGIHPTPPGERPMIGRRGDISRYRR
jgi:hypothetical protein